jgi:hypothetical protein
VSLSADDYAAWSQHHAALFGMHSRADAAMFSAWHAEFAACGYSRDELDEATRHCARESACTRWDMLQTIHRAIRDDRNRRAAISRRQTSAAGDRGVCDLCHDAAWVVVPHLAFVRDGEWIQHGASRPTMAVTCRCHRGIVAHNTAAATCAKLGLGTPISIERYEMLIDFWRDLIAAAAEDGRRRGRTEAITRDADIAGPLKSAIDQITRAAKAKARS